MFTRTDIKPFKNKIWLSTPTIHGEELEYIHDAFDKNWVTTAGKNITELEKRVAAYLSYSKDRSLYTVGLGNGTASIHLALKLAGLKINPGAKYTKGLLEGKRVFCSDLTFNATANPIVYEGGEPVFIDSEYKTWNMDPDALERAFCLFPETRIVIVANLYGIPAQLERIYTICENHNAILIEDAAESLGAYIISDKENGTGEKEKKQTGTFGHIGIISFNGNKIITGSTGGMVICNSKTDAEKIRKWSTQAREVAPWYQHEELGYNYRMSNIIAGIVCGQMYHLDEHIAAKKRIYERYRERLADLPIEMNPVMMDTEPNYWISCMTIRPEAMAQQIRSEHEALYLSTTGKTCPTEILEKMGERNCEGRPIWKPLHLQPLYRTAAFVTKSGDNRAGTDAYIEHSVTVVDEDVFSRGLCLPSDIKMSIEEQDKVIEIIRSCFD